MTWRLPYWPPAKNEPILIGPWRSEVGFESLYWLPWLAAWREKHQVDRNRLIVVTRGGAGAWYDAAKAVDLYDYVSVEKIRKAMIADSQATGSVKQQTVNAWERKLLAVIVDDLGVRRYTLLHPSIMYKQLTPWWEGQMGHTQLLKALRFQPMPVVAPPLSLPLPEHYVAVRFYHRHTWPLTEESKNWTQALVDTIAQRVPVVLLESGFHADEHLDFPLTGPNRQSIANHVHLQNNLAVQSAVIAKAKAFVGTYGGTMQLAVRLGKPSIGFYQKFEGTCYAHKHLTEWLAVQQRTPCFIGRPEDAQVIKDVMMTAT